ncbi:uncharacterized protein LOC121529983 [Drosophila eugracilis]|uniref:uncharacterized protein LOC121529983 n=1 Tax=Drosophila eugracilis TaxID=29029 RepID=UPI001BD9F2AD|nr:uncharacterized protein LOC121529983 [Drosophila eugracilis]
MEWSTKFLIFLLAFLSINFSYVFTMHNPMMRIKCDLGEYLTCKFKFVYCWLYECVCLPDHVYLELGFGCLYIEYL